MSALEQEILEKIRLLDKDAKQRIRQQLEQEEIEDGSTSILEPEISLREWLKEADVLRAEMHAKYGKLTYSIADMIQEMREERLNDIMDRY